MLESRSWPWFRVIAVISAQTIAPIVSFGQSRGCVGEPAAVCELAEDDRKYARFLLNNSFDPYSPRFLSFLSQSGSALRYRLLDRASRMHLAAANDERFLADARESLDLFPENPELQVDVARKALSKSPIEAMSRAMAAAVFAERAAPQDESILERRKLGISARAISIVITALNKAAIDANRNKGVFPVVERMYLVRDIVIAKSVSYLAEEMAEATTVELRFLVNAFTSETEGGTSGLHQLVFLAACERLTRTQKSAAIGFWRAETGQRPKIATGLHRDSRMLQAVNRKGVVRPSLHGISGSKSCDSQCHKVGGALFNNWRVSPMATILAARMPAFSPATASCTDAAKSGEGEVAATAQVREGTESIVIARVLRAGERDVHCILGNDGVWRAFPVVQVVGSQHLQAFLTQSEDDGQLYLLPIQKQLRTNVKKVVLQPNDVRWVSYGSLPKDQWIAKIRSFRVPPPPSWNRSVPEHLRIQQYESECAHCHTTSLQREIPPNSDGEHFRERGVGCEACHGATPTNPSAARAGHSWIPSGRADYEALCGYCHSHTTIPRSHTNMDANVHPPKYVRGSIEKFDSRRADEKTGLFTWSLFIPDAVRRTKCSILGDANCGSCHRVHGNFGVAKNKLSRADQKFPTRAEQKGTTVGEGKEDKSHDMGAAVA